MLIRRYKAVVAVLATAFALSRLGSWDETTPSTTPNRLDLEAYVPDEPTGVTIDRFARPFEFRPAPSKQLSISDFTWNDGIPLRKRPSVELTRFRLTFLHKGIKQPTVDDWLETDALEFSRVTGRPAIGTWHYHYCVGDNHMLSLIFCTNADTGERELDSWSLNDS